MLSWRVKRSHLKAKLRHQAMKKWRAWLTQYKKQAEAKQLIRIKATGWQSNAKIGAAFLADNAKKKM